MCTLDQTPTLGKGLNLFLKYVFIVKFKLGEMCIIYIHYLFTTYTLNKTIKGKGHLFYISIQQK